MMGFLRAYGVHLAIAGAVLFGLWFVDHRGYQRAKDQDNLARFERQTENTILVLELGRQLDGKLAALDAGLNAKLSTINQEEKLNVQPILTREILRDPGLADPGRCLSPGLLDAINAARGYSGGASSAAPGAGNQGAVPGSTKGH